MRKHQYVREWNPKRSLFSSIKGSEHYRCIYCGGILHYDEIAIQRLGKGQATCMKSDVPITPEEVIAKRYDCLAPIATVDPVDQMAKETTVELNQVNGVYQ